VISAFGYDPFNFGPARQRSYHVPVETKDNTVDQSGQARFGSRSIDRKPYKRFYKQGL
jgi:hypothetical protein